MKISKVLTKAIALVILFRGLLLVLGSILFGMDVLKGLAQMKPTLYVQFPYYILLAISAIGILRSRKWGIYLLFSLLAFDIFYWIVLGYYQPILAIILNSKHYPLTKVYGLILLFYKRLLVPIFLFIFFSLPQIKKLFVKHFNAI